MNRRAEPVRLSTVRAVTSFDAPPLTYADAATEAQAAHRRARDAYVETLGNFGGFRLAGLLRSREKVTLGVLRGLRKEAQAVVTSALAMVTAIDECIEIVERYEAHPEKR